MQIVIGSKVFSSAEGGKGMEGANRSRAHALPSRLGELRPSSQFHLAIAFLFSLNGSELSASDSASSSSLA